jgi:hypothetical protein
MQIVSSHYTPSLLHIPTMMMNVMASLKPMVEYSTRLLFLLFSTPFLLFFLLNNFASSSYFCLCSFLYVSFSLAIFCNFSIPLFVVMLPRTRKFQKCAQLLATNINCFRQLLCFFSTLNIPPIAFIFLLACHLLMNTWSSKLIRPITTSLCPLYSHMETLCIIIMNEHRRFHLLIAPHS